MDNVIDKELTLLYDSYEIDCAINNLVDEIANVKNPDWVFLMILKGGVHLGMRLIDQLGTDIPYGFIGLNSYDKGTKSTGRVQCTYKPLFGPDFFQNKDILLIDDVFESGITFEYAKKMFANTGYRSLKGVVLVRKGNKYIKDTCLWHSGLQYLGDKFIVGCGMGLGEKYRSYNCIYTYKESKYVGIK